MRVLEVIEATSAGVGRHVASLCPGLVEAGCEVTVAYSPRRLDAAFRRFMEEYAGRIRFVAVDLRREVSPLSDARGLAALVRLIRWEGPFDVVHGHSSKGGALGRMAGRLCGLPTVYTPHSLIMSSPEVSRRRALIYGAVEKALGRLATSRMVAVSSGERDFILRLGLVEKERLVTIRNCLHDHDFSSPIPRPDRPLTFGSTMRFSHQKAPGLLVEAFMRSARALPHLPMRLLVAGSGELYEEVREMVEEAGWEDRVLLPGWSDDPASVLAQLDVFVVSSHYEAGLSYSTMEAMAAGLPVVSTAVFGARETVGAVEGNAIVAPGDVGELGNGMARMAELHAQPGGLRRIGEANREYVRRHFRQEDADRRHVELYRSLTGGPSSAPVPCS